MTRVAGHAVQFGGVREHAQGCVTQGGMPQALTPEILGVFTYCIPCIAPILPSQMFGYNLLSDPPAGCENGSQKKDENWKVGCIVPPFSSVFSLHIPLGPPHISNPPPILTQVLPFALFPLISPHFPHFFHGLLGSPGPLDSGA